MQYQKARAPRQLKQEYFGQAPNVFVGRYGYPNIRVGIMGTEQYTEHDDPQGWSLRGTPIPDIVQLRSEIINSFYARRVSGTTDVFGSAVQDVSLAKRPVDVEIRMAKPPVFKMTYGRDVTPHGPNVPLRHAIVTENIPVDTRVDKAVDATDLKAADAVGMLAKKHIDPYYLTKVFSMGNFGLQTERKLVPTRWSITAIDDIRGKDLLQEIRTYEQSDCLAYFGGHYGNEYLILFFDDVWQYELFEHHVSSAQTWTDYEPFTGRKAYAAETAGGYYAARIGILESLKKRKRQSAVLALRFITDDYSNPLGVWVVREAVNKTLATKPTRFADRHLMLAYARAFLQKKYSFDLMTFLRKSSLVKHVLGQQKLTTY